MREVSMKEIELAHHYQLTIEVIKVGQCDQACHDADLIRLESSGGRSCFVH